MIWQLIFSILRPLKVCETRPSSSDIGNICMKNRFLRLTLVYLSLGGGLFADYDPNPSPGAPSASRQIPLRMGNLDAITGNLAIRVPLGPTLPGRIKLEFKWYYNSTNLQQFHLSGGFRPVVWPEMKTLMPEDPIVRTVAFNGDPWTFLVNPSPAAGAMPTVEALHAEMLRRGVDDGQASAVAHHEGCSMPAPVFRMEVFPTADGTRFLLHTWWDNDFLFVDVKHPDGICKKATTESRWVILDGPNTVWSKDPVKLTDPRVTYFSNRWGDLVSVTESGGNYGGPTTITILNEKFATHSITLDRSSGNLVVTNTMGLPKATLVGTYQTQNTITSVCGSTLGEFYGGFRPDRLLEETQGESRTTTFTWLNNPDRTDNQYSSLHSIQFPSGLKETFQGGQATKLSKNCFDPPYETTSPPDCQWQSTGKWTGYSPFSAYDYAPLSQGGFVDRVITELPDGSGQTIQVLRMLPSATGTHPATRDDLTYAKSFTWTAKDYTTTVLHLKTAVYGSAFPPSQPYRGVRMIHPSASTTIAPFGWGAPSRPVDEQRTAYLFATSAVLKEEEISGSQLDSATGQPSDAVTSRTTIYDGWDLRSWANPTGSLTIGLPVNAQPLRTRVYETPMGTSQQPTRMSLVSSFDDRGPRQTDEYTQSPQAIPSVTGTSPIVWSDSAPAPATPEIHRQSVITRHWDSTLFQLLVDTEQKSLDGSQLNALRGVATADFGTISYTYDSSGRLTQTDGVRGGIKATEKKTYEGSTPHVATVRKSLSGISVAQPDLMVGQDFHYFLGTVHEGLKDATTYPDGRSTAYQRDDLGRETRVTDVNGISADTTYDSWGRVWTRSRGGLTTTLTYDPNGLWMQESVAGEGRTLTTRTDFDALGRTVLTTGPDGSHQTTTFDGFGQMTEQSPVLRPGLTSWGNNRWDYDDRGRLIRTRDSQGRTLSTFAQPTWGSLSGEPRPGVLAVVTDDRGYSRSELTDLLGQKIAVLDQKGQLTRYLYDGDGHLSGTNQGGQIRNYTYNSVGWLMSRTEPEEGQTVFSSHTLLGAPLIATYKGLSGNSSTTVSTVLNGWGLPRTVTHSSPNGTFTRTLQDSDYDPTTHLPKAMSETQPNGTLTETYGYDSLARLNTRTVSDGTRSFSISRELDAFGGVKSLIYPAGGGRTAQTVTTTYDGKNRPWTVNLDSVQRAQMVYGTGSGNSITDVLIYGNGATSASRMTMGELTNLTHGVTLGIPGNAQSNDLTWTAGGLMLSRGGDSFIYDELQRLSYAKTFAPGGEVAEQWFTYDRWGNRTQSDYTYTAPPGGMPKPYELVALRATMDGANHIVAADAVYDDLGRLTEVNAVPGDANSLTRWVYDPSGRITSETTFGNLTNFLLDGEGLRFKRMKADGSVEYTVYGFNREPLSHFTWTPQVITQASALPLKAQTLTATRRKTVALAIGGGDPADAIILSPGPNTTVHVGDSIAFVGQSDVGTKFTWTFGDGTTASTLSVNKAYSAAGYYLVTIKASGTGYSIGQATLRITVIPALPVISGFTSSASTIPVGSASTLSWTVSGATSLSIDNGVGSVIGTSSCSVSPTTSTTYSLSATNAGGTVTRQVSMTVVQPPTISSLGASPSSIYKGDGSTLNWSVSGATSLSLDNGIGTVSGTSYSVSPSSTATYTLTATNTVNGVSVNRTAATTIYVSPRPTVPTINAFTADAGAIAAGSGTTLRWNVSNSVGDAIVTITSVGSVGTSGSLSVTPSATTTYTLTATNSLDSSKSVSASVTVSVVSPPVINFTANPGAVNVGGSSTLNWSVANSPTSVSIDQGIGSVGVSGSRAVTPGSTSTYTLTASNLAGTVSIAATVSVTQKPVIASFAAAASPITQGSSTSLNWMVQGATSLKVNGSAVSGTSLLVSPTQTTTYTLVASNSAGSDTKISTITVVVPESFLWKKNLVYGLGTLISEERPDGTFYVQGDQVGSPNLITNASGAVVGLAKNLPFGERFYSLGEKSSRRYTNHEDQEGSAIYMQARTYLPAYGKFAQVDPVYDQMKSDPETWNLYNYVTNNPVTHTDPDGRRAAMEWRFGPPAWLSGGEGSFLFGWGAQSTAAPTGYLEVVKTTVIDWDSLPEATSQSGTQTAAAGGTGALNAGTAAARLNALAAANPADATALTRAAGALSDPTTTSTIVPNGSLGADVGGNSGWTNGTALVASGSGFAANSQFINMTQGAVGNLQDWAHEGTHNADRAAQAAVALAGGTPTMTNLMTERSAYAVTQTVLRLTGTTATYSGVTLYNSQWSRLPAVQRDSLQATALTNLMTAIGAGLGNRANNLIFQ